MKTKDLALAVALAAVAAPIPVMAGDPENLSLSALLRPGDRVRVWATTAPNRTVGEVVEYGPGLLKVRGSDGRSVEIPLASISRLQRSLGRHSAIGEGAAKGALIGAAAGAAFFTIAWATSEDQGCEGSCAFYALAFTGLGAGGGVLIGSAVGSGLQTERWTTVPVGRIGVSVVPKRRGAGIALSVRF